MGKGEERERERGRLGSTVPIKRSQPTLTCLPLSSSFLPSAERKDTRGDLPNIYGSADSRIPASESISNGDLANLNLSKICLNAEIWR